MTKLYCFYCHKYKAPELFVDLNARRRRCKTCQAAVDVRLKKEKS